MGIGTDRHTVGAIRPDHVPIVKTGLWVNFPVHGPIDLTSVAKGDGFAWTVFSATGSLIEKWSWKDQAPL